jgi:hypothetical protein
MIAGDDSLLADVLAVATVTDILRLYGCTVPDNPKRAILCPLHAERSPSFCRLVSGNRDQGYRCHGCGAHGGVLDLVVALKLAPSRKGAVDMLAGLYGLAKGFRGYPVKAPRRSKLLELEIRTATPSPQLTAAERADLLDALRRGRPLLGGPGEEYLWGRGIDPTFAVSCRVGYHPSWLGRGEAVIFLGFDMAGNLVAAQGRFLRPGSGPKAMSRGRIALGVFSTPGGHGKGLYGQGGPVAIVESPLDAIALAQNGLAAIALLGASNRQAWLVDVLSGRNVVIAREGRARDSEMASLWHPHDADAIRRRQRCRRASPKVSPEARAPRRRGGPGIKPASLGRDNRLGGGLGSWGRLQGRTQPPRVYRDSSRHCRPR